MASQVYILLKISKFPIDHIGFLDSNPLPFGWLDRFISMNRKRKNCHKCMRYTRSQESKTCKAWTKLQHKEIVECNESYCWIHVNSLSFWCVSIMRSLYGGAMKPITKFKSQLFQFFLISTMGACKYFDGPASIIPLQLYQARNIKIKHENNTRLDFVWIEMRHICFDRLNEINEMDQ